ncbi:MAG: hypothetical protein WC001_10410 [Desulfurivibrionaceae bacterium]
MINISGSSSLLEIMFGVNAVFVVVVSQYFDNIEKIYNHVKSEINNSRIDDLPEIDEKFLKKASYKVYVNFKLLNTIFLWTCLMLSSLGTLIPLSLLTWSAILPDNSQIPVFVLIIIVFIFIIVSPMQYCIFVFYSRKIIKRICYSHLDEYRIRQIAILAGLCRLDDDMDDNMYNVKLILLRNNINSVKRKTRNLFAKTLNPIYRYKIWRLNKLYGELNDK